MGMKQNKCFSAGIRIFKTLKPVFEPHGLVAAALPAVVSLLLAWTEPCQILIPSIVSPCEAGEQYAVNVHRDESSRETIYRVFRDDCTVEWIARDVEPGVIKNRVECPFPLAEQILLMEKLYAVFLQKDPNARVLRTLFWGRLEPEESSGSWEMAFRLALGAYKSPGWDARRGKPKNGDYNGFVKDLANGEMIYPELKALFEGFNRNIKFSCAEKVLVEKAGKLPFFEALKPHGVKAEDILPFDCMTWFSITAK
jgi:hypothetical protein